MIKYVCGPIAGHPDLNEPAFREAMSTIAAGGDALLVPHDIKPHWHMGDCAPVYGSPAAQGGHDGGCYLRADIAAFLRVADAVYCLPSWTRSRGAQIEVLTAVLDGIAWPEGL